MDPVLLASTATLLQRLTQTVNKSSEELAEADPKHVQELAAAQLRIINSYYLRFLSKRDAASSPLS